MKFNIVKHFDLSYLGEGWEEAHIDFKPLTIADVKSKLPEIAKLQTDDASFASGIDTLVDLLKEKFISGKAVGEDKQLVVLGKEDLSDFPVEVIGRAFTFLSKIEVATS